MARLRPEDIDTEAVAAGVANVILETAAFRALYEARAFSFEQTKGFDGHFVGKDGFEIKATGATLLLMMTDLVPKVQARYSPEAVGERMVSEMKAAHAEQRGFTDEPK